MSRRLMLRNASGGGILPPKYQRVEWIGRTGELKGAYIDTGITEASGISIHAFIELFDFNDSKIIGTYNGGIAVLNSELRVMDESYNPVTTGQLFQQGINDAIYYAEALNPSALNPSIISYTLNSQTVTKAAQFRSTYCNYYLLACNYRSSNYYSGFNGRLHYYVEFLSNGETIAFFVPCYRKSDGEIGMYDTVSQAFFTNAGTGTFTKGADV